MKSKDYSLLMDTAAVITGDLIGSTGASTSDVDRAMAALSNAAQTISSWTKVDTRFTRFRGDGWQVFLSEPSLVFRATLLLLAKLRSEGQGLMTRLSIAVGPVDRLGKTGLGDAAGTAFTLSGRNLDRMLSFRTFVFTDSRSTSEKKDYWKPATLDLAVWQASLWTREQAEAVALAIDMPRPTDAELAERLGISRQAVQSRLKGSGLMATSRALLAFELDFPWPENKHD